MLTYRDWVYSWKTSGSSTGSSTQASIDSFQSPLRQARKNPERAHAMSSCGTKDLVASPVPTTTVKMVSLRDLHSVSYCLFVVAIDTHGSMYFLSVMLPKPNLAYKQGGGCREEGLYRGRRWKLERPLTKEGARDTNQARTVCLPRRCAAEVKARDYAANHKRAQ